MPTKLSKNIIITNQKKFDFIKNQIIKDGANKLHILTDFDRTLTKAFSNKKKSSTSFSQIRNGGYLGPEYMAKAQALFDKYYPIEINNHLSRDGKAKSMLKWWNKHFDLLINHGFNKKILDQIVKSSDIKLRPGVLKFIKWSKEKNVPIAIMSAGLGDLILENLRINNCLHKNIFPITNTFKFDKKGKITEAPKPIIHVMNKHEVILSKFSAYQKIKNKKNVLLLGDSLEDIGMIEGFKYDNLLKIGFFNKKIETKNLNELKLYKKNYDVIITNDSSMSFINNLCQEII